MTSWRTWRIQPWMMRRLALLLAMLISGGMPVFPREPLLLLLIVLCLGLSGMRLPTHRSLWPLGVLLAAILVATLVRPGPVSLPSLLSRYTIYLAAALLVQVYLLADSGALQRDLKALLLPMAMQALLTVLLAHTLGGLFVPMAAGAQEYMTLLGIFNFHVLIEELGGLIRPDGFFFEPGVFQIYLNLYLYLELFYFRRPACIALAVLAVLCTQSTTGMVICVMLLATFLLDYLDRHGPQHRRSALLLALLLAPPLLYLGYENITDKLFGVAQGSSWARQYDLFTGVSIFLENPLLGIGFDVDRYLAESARLGYDGTLLTLDQLEDRPTSNGIIQLLYVFGAPLAIPFFYALFRQKLFPHRKLIGCWLLLSLFGEALLFTPFFLFVVFSAFRSSRGKVAETGKALTRRSMVP